MKELIKNTRLAMEAEEQKLISILVDEATKQTKQNETRRQLKKMKIKELINATNPKSIK